MIAGDLVFKGEEFGMDQLVEIICVLGTITEGEMEAMGTVLPSLDDKVLASRLVAECRNSGDVDLVNSQKFLPKWSKLSTPKHRERLMCPMVKFFEVV